MYFIEGLPKFKDFIVIFVVVDRLSKYAHFMPLSHPYTTLFIAQVFLDTVYKLHGLPTSSIFDQDKIFTSNFWQELFKLLGTQLKLSTTYHPQTNGQTEIVNCGLKAYLHEWSN